MTMNQQQPWWSKSTSETTAVHRPPKSTFRRGVVGIGVSFLAVISIMVGGLIIGPNPDAPKPGGWNSTMYPADVDSLIAECGETFVFDTDQKYFGAIPDDYFIDPNSGIEVARNVPNHPMRVPVFGYFINDENLSPEQKFFSPDDEDILPERHIYLKYLWDGWNIIWYAPDVDLETQNAIRDYTETHDKIVAMPWIDDVPMPMGRNFAFSGWNISRSCDKWDSDVATAFVGDAAHVYEQIEGAEPNTVQLTDDGNLPLIDIPE